MVDYVRKMTPRHGPDSLTIMQNVAETSSLLFNSGDGRKKQNLTPGHQAPYGVDGLQLLSNETGFFFLEAGEAVAHQQ